MSDIFRQAVTALEQELEAIHQRAHEIQKAIDILTPMAGPEEDDAPPARGKARAKPVKTAAAAVADDEVGPQESGRREKILTALQDGPLKTAEVAAAIRVDKKPTKKTLQRMAAADLIKGVGAGPGRRWTLPRAAKEAL